MAKNPGIICKVLEGVHQGQIAFAPNAKQNDKFAAIGKLYVEFYEDSLLNTPVVDSTGLRMAGLISKDKLKLIGFSD